MALLQVLKDFGSVIAAGVALFLGVYGDGIRAWMKRPELSFGLSDGPPDCHMTDMTRTFGRMVMVATTRCYYLRFRVHNFGKSSAHDVEVVVTGVEQQDARGEFHQMPEFLPINLLWSHTREHVTPRISPGGDVPRYCDFGHIMPPEMRETFGETHGRLHGFEGRAALALDLSHAPATGTHLFPPGAYRFHVAATASNASVARAIIRVEVTGEWTDDEDSMRSRGVRIHLDV